VSGPAANAQRVLHLVLRAGNGAFESCRACCTAGDAVLFLDDGVRQLLLGEPGRLLPPGVAVHYSLPDLKARGLAGAAAIMNARTLCDGDFSAMLQLYDECLSWK
jgi:sulfur transfer complex TusBCD TusB component (DsrH family)